MKEYIEVKIKKIQEKSDPEGYLSRLASSDTEIRRLWKTEKENDNVMNLVNHFDGQVRFVEKNVPYGSGHIEDGYNMALAEYRAIQGLRKMAQFINPSPFHKTSFAPLSEIEIDELFDRMNSIIDRMNQQNLRRAMQD